MYVDIPSPIFQHSFVRPSRCASGIYMLAKILRCAKEHVIIYYKVSACLLRNDKNPRLL